MLDERVKEVRITRRLTESPACLVADEHEMGRHLEQILKASGQEIPGSKPILGLGTEFNSVPFQLDIYFSLIIVATTSECVANPG